MMESLRRFDIVFKLLNASVPERRSRVLQEEFSDIRRKHIRCPPAQEHLGRGVQPRVPLRAVVPDIAVSVHQKEQVRNYLKICIEQLLLRVTVTDVFFLSRFHVLFCLLSPVSSETIPHPRQVFSCSA
ncbi:hypothetical protein SDC9_183254 [bioreactor metagenome]|uniref:Uncharacterized protein n=1 Tax=bioreactor metagenome TaxID=1076179 RepID=A0A645H9S2_9ZZZZ